MVTTRKELVRMTAKQYTGIVLTVLVLVSFACAIAEAGKPVGLTPEAIDKLKSSFENDPHTKALVNAITNNSVRDLSLNREFYVRHEDVFNFKIENKAGVTNQKSSGRCWIFAGFNIMRPAVMEKYNLKAFEFSENHLFFWDKLEKANLFLEAVIETKKKVIDDRELQILVKDPVPDGGWWTYVVSLVEKYGAVPKQVMPETENSSNTQYMNTVINRMMRRDAVELRTMAERGKKDSALRARKFEMLKDVYRILALHLGVPPEEFTWRCEDKDGEIVEGTYTPVSFYQEAVGVDLSEYVSVFDHPMHPYNKYYEIRYCRNMPDIPDMDFVNLEVGLLKEFALKALLDGEPVWFACDVGKENDATNGVMAVGVYDYESLYGVDARLTKAERLLYSASTPNHAMAFIGVDTVRGEPVKWLVENSWGTDRGNKGFWTMYDEWFDEYVYTVIIHRRHLPDDVLRLLDTKPTVLPAWDPMRAVF